MPLPKINPKKKMAGIADSFEVDKVLASLRSKSEEEEASQLAKKLGYPYLDLNIYPIDQEHLTMISEEEAKKYGAVLIYRADRDAKMAVLDPKNAETDGFAKQFAEKNGLRLTQFVISQSSFERALKEYGKSKLVNVFDYLRMGLSGKDLEEFEGELKDLIELEKRISELPTTQVLALIIAGAVKMEASDIHMEPTKREVVRMRYRIDGLLQTVAEFPISIYQTIVSRVKILSGMMLNVRDVSQDGRFSIKQEDGREIDVRSSILPGNYGEYIVIRLLNQDITSLTVNALGVQGASYEKLLKEADRKEGMIINSGPTGSGKTTTLYAIINKINSPDTKVISIENPIEYQIDGVNQTQVEEDRGYTFENGLRSIVRQDPDIILVGEIRDEATAEIATHAALTGHLVLTTVHANSAAGVVGRLIDLGVKPTLISSAANAFIAQRLLRKLCPHCKEKYVPAEETIETLKKMLSLISPRAEVEVPKNIEHLWRPKGCPKCRGLGYKGRVGIFEIFTISREIQHLIERMSSEDEIRIQALEEGMITLEQDGVLKSIEGATSLEELQRVVGKGDYLVDLYEKIIAQTLSRGVRVEKEIMDKISKFGADFNKLKDEFKELSPSAVLKYVLAGALLMRAGDIHIEPGEKEFKIRYRIDGILHDIIAFSMSEFLNVLGEVKNLSGFKTESRVGVIDGRFRIVTPKDVVQFEGNSVDVRVSIILGGYGDIVVMRLLNQSAQATDLEKIGLLPINLELLKNNISKPNGIVLNTGPTGSGKTTTLYSALALLNKPELKIITVEDPIEYHMDGVIQTQVNEAEKYTFATAMRSLLRQNPDIMMIGEIRDEEAAKIAYQASLTGHLVLTTLHANSAAGALQRLVNMGVSLSDLAAGTNCFMAQRLVRVLCPHCKKEHELEGKERLEIETVLKSISSAAQKKIKLPKIGKIYRPGGCEQCQNIGYHGRVPVAEILEVDAEMQKFFTTNPTTVELNNRAIENGMITMAQDGIIRVLNGETSLEEISRIAMEVREA